MPAAMVTILLTPLGKTMLEIWQNCAWKNKILKTSYTAEMCFNCFTIISVLWEGNSDRVFWIIQISISPLGERSSGLALHQSASLPPSVLSASHKPAWKVAWQNQGQERKSGNEATAVPAVELPGRKKWEVFLIITRFHIQLRTFWNVTEKMNDFVSPEDEQYFRHELNIHLSHWPRGSSPSHEFTLLLCGKAGNPPSIANLTAHCWASPWWRLHLLEAARRESKQPGRHLKHH